MPNGSTLRLILLSGEWGRGGSGARALLWLTNKFFWGHKAARVVCSLSEGLRGNRYRLAARLSCLISESIKEKEPSGSHAICNKDSWLTRLKGGNKAGKMFWSENAREPLSCSQSYPADTGMHHLQVCAGTLKKFSDSAARANPHHGPDQFLILASQRWANRQVPCAANPPACCKP